MFFFFASVHVCLSSTSVFFLMRARVFLFLAPCLSSIHLPLFSSPAPLSLFPLFFTSLIPHYISTSFTYFLHFLPPLLSILFLPYFPSDLRPLLLFPLHHSGILSPNTFLFPPSSFYSSFVPCLSLSLLSVSPSLFQLHNFLLLSLSHFFSFTYLLSYSLPPYFIAPFTLLPPIFSCLSNPF